MIASTEDDGWDQGNGAGSPQSQENFWSIEDENIDLHKNCQFAMVPKGTSHDWGVLLELDAS